MGTQWQKSKQSKVLDETEEHKFVNNSKQLAV